MTWLGNGNIPGYMNLQERDALIARVNPPENFINADDKIVMAQLAAAAGLPHLPIYEVIETHEQMNAAIEKILQYKACVIKPAKGMGGSGILLLNGQKITPHEIRTHIENILSGLYSMGAQPDRAMVQYYVQPHGFFTALHGSGVADIRVIVYMGTPIMAMLRLPTRESGGKGNLHAGAIGVGIEMATGVTTHGIYRGGAVMVHPDTQVVLTRHVVPFWEEIVQMAARCFAMSGLGYLGVDIVIDVELGPMVLEINAWPGLGIQSANQTRLNINQVIEK